jgi:hypothetical protein
MKDYMKMLARKGTVTIVKHTRRNKKNGVKLQLPSGDVVALSAKVPIDQLLAELCQMCKNWPDMPEE